MSISVTGEEDRFYRHHALICGDPFCGHFSHRYAHALEAAEPVYVDGEQVSPREPEGGEKAMPTKDYSGPAACTHPEVETVDGPAVPIEAEQQP